MSVKGCFESSTDQLTLIMADDQRGSRRSTGSRKSCPLRSVVVEGVSFDSDVHAVHAVVASAMLFCINACPRYRPLMVQANRTKGASANCIKVADRSQSPQSIPSRSSGRNDTVRQGGTLCVFVTLLLVPEWFCLLSWKTVVLCCVDARSE